MFYFISAFRSRGQNQRTRRPGKIVSKVTDGREVLLAYTN